MLCNSLRLSPLCRNANPVSFSNVFWNKGCYLRIYPSSCVMRCNVYRGAHDKRLRDQRGSYECSAFKLTIFSSGDVQKNKFVRRCHGITVHSWNKDTTKSKNTQEENRGSTQKKRKKRNRARISRKCALYARAKVKCDLRARAGRLALAAKRTESLTVDHTGAPRTNEAS